jgi:hypothetical protein
MILPSMVNSVHAVYGVMGQQVDSGVSVSSIAGKGGLYAGHFGEMKHGERDTEYILGVIAAYVCVNDIAQESHPKVKATLAIYSSKVVGCSRINARASMRQDLCRFCAIRIVFPDRAVKEKERIEGVRSGTAARVLSC